MCLLTDILIVAKILKDNYLKKIKYRLYSLKTTIEYFLAKITSVTHCMQIEMRLSAKGYNQMTYSNEETEMIK